MMSSIRESFKNEGVGVGGGGGGGGLQSFVCMTRHPYLIHVHNPIKLPKNIPNCY